MKGNCLFVSAILLTVFVALSFFLAFLLGKQDLGKVKESAVYVIPHSNLVVRIDLLSDDGVRVVFASSLYSAVSWLDGNSCLFYRGPSLEENYYIETEPSNTVLYQKKHRMKVKMKEKNMVLEPLPVGQSVLNHLCEENRSRILSVVIEDVHEMNSCHISLMDSQGNFMETIPPVPKDSIPDDSRFRPDFARSLSE